MMDRAKENQSSHLRRLVRNDGFQFTDTFFPYTSGEIGPYYVQSAAIQKNGDDFYQACKDMTDLVKTCTCIAPRNFNVISGGETRDWMFSFPISIDLKVPHAMLYKNGKIYGADMKDKKVVHIADLNNEGSSPRDYWVPAIKKAGGSINQIFFYVDRMEDGVKEMKKLGLFSNSLIPLDKTAWEILLDEEVINRNIYNNLRQRMEDKYEWAKDMLRSDKGLERLAELTMDPKTTEKVINILCVGYPFLKEDIVERLHKKYGKEVTSKLPVFTF
jgi:orotate phosphoribosyltransferase